MIANMNEKGRQTKLLAAIAIIAMVVCVFAVAMPSVSATADDSGEGADTGSTTNVAQVGENTYETIASAITAIDGKGKITLIGDATEHVEIPAGKTITIDLAGHTITFNGTSAQGTMEDNSDPAGATVLVKGTLTINDSVGEGTVIQTGTSASAAVHVSVGGVLTINDGIYEVTDESTSAFYTIKNLGAVTINGGSVICNSGINSGTDGSSAIANGWSNSANNTDNNTAKMYIYGGNFNGAHYVKNDKSGEMYIYGGTFSGTNRGAAIMNWNVLVIDDDYNSAQDLVVNQKNATDVAVLNAAYGEYGVGELTIMSGTFNTHSIVRMASGYSIGTIEIASGLGTTAFSSGAATIIGSIAIGDNSIEFNGVKFSSNVIIKEGSVILSGTIAGSSTASITAGGEVKLDGVTVTGDSGSGLKIDTVDDGKNKVIIQNLTLDGSSTLSIENGANVEVPADGKLVNSSEATTPISNAGNFVLYSTITDENGVASTQCVNNTGSLAVAPGVTNPVTSASAETGTVVSTTTLENALGLNQNLDSDYTVTTKAFLEKNLIIASGVTLTVNGTLDLNGQTLIVNGNLVIGNAGAIVDGVGGGKINLSKSGVITNNGGLGKGSEVIVGLIDTQSGSRDIYGTGTVTVKDAYGIGFSIDRTVNSENNTINYTLAVSGDVSRKGNVNGTVEVSGDVIAKDTFAIGNGITFSVAVGGKLIVDSGAAFEIDSRGAMSSGTVFIKGGATVNLNGNTTGTFQASTGKYLTNGTYTNGSKTNTTQIEVINIVGLTLEATTASAYDADLKNTVTEDRLVISGAIEQGTFNTETDDDTNGVTYDSASLNIEKDNNTAVDPTIDIDMQYVGVYVVGSLDVADDIDTFTMDGIQFTVLGTVTYDNDGFSKAVTENATLSGAVYSIESVNDRGAKTYINYIRPFDAAFADIANAYETTITVYGSVEITGELTLADGQEISGGEYQISETGKFTVGNGAIMSVGSMDVQGILVVMADGNFTCVPENFNYSAVSQNDAGDRTYSGFMVALNGASEGDVIEVSKYTSVESSFTIPAGVTVRITETGELDAKKDVTVNGVLDNEGTVTVAGNTVVGSTGSIDLTEDISTTFTGTVDVTGTITNDSLFGNTVKVNAFQYQNDDGYYVYTSFGKAVDAVSQMDVFRTINQVGTVTDSSAVTLENIVLNITGTASLGDVTLTDGRIVVIGTLTANITGPSGDEGSTVDSTLSLTKAEDVTVTSTSVPNAQNVQVWSLTITTDSEDESLTGDVAITAGTVSI